MAQNESVETTINSRVMSKIDTAENWETNNPKLLKGEVVPVIVTDSNGNITNVAFKVGDGVSNYATLPFASANAWDVFDWAKAESVEIRIANDSKYYIDFFDVGSTPNEKTIIKSVELFTVDQTYSNDSKNAQSGKAISSALSSKVDKVTGKALSTNDFTTALLDKLNGIAAGANKYVHPSHTAYATAGLYKITVDALGHITSAAAVTKDDITKLGIPAITVDAAMSDTSTNPVQNKVVKAEIDSKALNVIDTGSGNLSISSLGYSSVTTNSVYISDFTDTDTASVDESGNAVSTQSTGSDGISTRATVDAASNIILKSIYFNDLDTTYRIPSAVTVDDALSSLSTNPVQNTVINTALAGKTDLSASGASSLINKLNIDSDAPSDADYFVSQYAGGGTINTNYYRRPVSALNTYIKSKADKTPTSGSVNLITSGAVYTALSGKASSTHTHTLNQVTAGAFNTTGSVDYISRSLVPYVSGTKFYGMPAAAITVEYSRDAGATWIDYGLNDGAKMRIFDHSVSANLYLGKASTKADNNINNMLRITIDATKSDGRYLSTDSMFTWMTSNGNTTCVTLEVASYNAPTTFRTIVNNAPINGWSGPNISHYNLITFGGSTAGSTSTNNQFYRLTYKQTAINSNYPSALISDIRFFGSTLWNGGKSIVDHMLRQGAPYGVTVDPDTTSGTVNFSLLGATFGNGTSAAGKYSLAGGINSIVNHEGSVAYGSNLNTSSQYQAVFGKYNKTDASALLQIGNGTSTSARSNAFEVYSDGHAEVQKTGTTDNSLTTKKYVDDLIIDKQDKFATITTTNTIQTVKIGDNLSIVTSPNFSYSQISSSKILVLSGEDTTTSYVSLRKTKLDSSCDFDATQGYLRVRDNPLADDFAVNKKYVTTAVSNKLDADTDNYNIAYDTTSEAIKITFKN